MQGTSQHGRGLTKAIVFSQFWMHIQLISSHLRAHEVPLAVLKQDMSPKDKAAAVATFQVRCVSNTLSEIGLEDVLATVA